MQSGLLVIGIFDPLTRGHEKLFDLGLSISDRLEVYIGKRGSRLKTFLPYPIRRQALELLAGEEKYDSNLVILPASPTLMEMTLDKDKELLVGSDLIKQCYIENQVAPMQALFERFYQLHIVQRKGNELSESDLRLIRHSFEVELYSQISGISSTQTRENIKGNTPFLSYLPPCTHDLVTHNLDYFLS